MDRPRASFTDALRGMPGETTEIFMDYTVIKLVHISAVALSGFGFLLRGMASLRGASWVRGRVAKTLPHAVDTVLLVSALTLYWMSRLSLFGSPWLLAKGCGLLVYIAAGTIALRARYACYTRTSAYVFALLTFAWMVSVASLKTPVGFFAFLVGA